MVTVPDALDHLPWGLEIGAGLPIDVEGRRFSAATQTISGIVPFKPHESLTQK